MCSDPAFVKRRGRPAPGSIPEALQIFQNEIRFYEEIAPVIGIRVPLSLRAEENPDGTRLVLEDVSGWEPGAEPAVAARMLADVHRRFEGRALDRWPWLRPAGAAADLVGELFDRTWPELAGRSDLTPNVRVLGERLVGRVAEAAHAVAGAGSLTLVHGDPSLRNFRTGHDRQVVLLDREDGGAAPDIMDLAWLLVSSIDQQQWNAAIASYGRSTGLPTVLPAAVIQAFLSLASLPDGSPEALAFVSRLTAAAERLDLSVS